MSITHFPSFFYLYMLISQELLLMLDPFENLSKIQEEEYHNKFKLLKNSLLREKEIFLGWLNGLSTVNNKILHEFQKEFHPSFWKFYLLAVFSDSGFQMDFSKNSSYLLVSSPQQILIEAVVSNIKEVVTAEKDETLEDLQASLIPPHLSLDYSEVLDQAIVRHSVAIKKKWTKYIKNYSKLSHLNGENPFVIALSSYDQINHGREFLYPMVALLYGLYYDPMTDDYLPRTSIKKPGSRSDIPLGFFNNAAMEDIAAILFSCTTTLDKLTSLARSESDSGLNGNIVNILQTSGEPAYRAQFVSPDDPEQLSDGLFLFHNPFSKNPLERKTFAGTNIIQVYLEGNNFRFEGNRPPIYSRINTIIKLPEPYMDMVINRLSRR